MKSTLMDLDDIQWKAQRSIARPEDTLLLVSRVRELEAQLSGCPWDLPLDWTCPKHGDTLRKCPVGSTTVSVDCTPVAAKTVFVSR